MLPIDRTGRFDSYDDYGYDGESESYAGTDWYLVSEGEDRLDLQRIFQALEGKTVRFRIESADPGDPEP